MSTFTLTPARTAAEINNAALQNLRSALPVKYKNQASDILPDELKRNAQLMQEVILKPAFIAQRISSLVSAFDSLGADSAKEGLKHVFPILLDRFSKGLRFAEDITAAAQVIGRLAHTFSNPILRYSLLKNEIPVLLEKKSHALTPISLESVFSDVAAYVDGAKDSRSTNAFKAIADKLGIKINGTSAEEFQIIGSDFKAFNDNARAVGDITSVCLNNALPVIISLGTSSTADTLSGEAAKAAGSVISLYAVLKAKNVPDLRIARFFSEELKAHLTEGLKGNKTIEAVINEMSKNPDKTIKGSAQLSMQGKAAIKL